MATGPALHLIHVRRHKLQAVHPPLTALGAAKALFYQVTFGGSMESLPVVSQGVLGPQFLDARWAFHTGSSFLGQVPPYITQPARNIKLFLDWFGIRQ
jgi:hypothetical protein